MDTERMIRNLEKVEEDHKDDKVFTGQLNIADMVRDVRKRLEELKPYEDTDLTPQQIKDMQFCLREKSRECAELRRELQELKKRDMAWECLKDKVRRKLNLIRKGAPMSRKEEGYEAALLAVLSMIHELKSEEE